MTFVIRVAFALVFAVLFYTPLSAQPKSDQTGRQASRSIAYSDERGRFSVTLPSAPVVKKTQTSGETSIDIYTFNVEHGNNGYVIQYNDFTPGVASAANNKGHYETLIASRAKAATIRKVNDHILNGYSGIQVIYDASQRLPSGATAHHTAVMRAYFVGDRLYQITFTAPLYGENSPEASAFLDSFRIEPQPVAPAARTSQRGVNQTANIDEAEEYYDDDVRFTVRFPGKPTERVQKIPMNGATTSIHTVSFDKSGRTYSVVYNDYPRNAQLPSYDTVIRGYTANGHKIRSIAEHMIVTIDEDVVGRHVVMEGPNGKFMLHMRVYIVGNRVYQAMYYGPPNVDTAREAREFLESFDILE